MRELVGADGQELLLVESVQQSVREEYRRRAERRQRQRVRDDPASEIDAFEARLWHAARIGERTAPGQEFSFSDRPRAQA